MLVGCKALIIQAYFRQSKMGRHFVNHERMEYELARKVAKYAVNICMDWRRDAVSRMEGVNAFLKYVVCECSSIRRLLIPGLMLCR